MPCRGCTTRRPSPATCASTSARPAKRSPGGSGTACGCCRPTGLGGRLLARAAKWNAEHLARRFIAGSNVEEAARSRSSGCATKSLGFTVDLLGEATITEPEADAVQKQYLDLIAGLTREVNAWPEVPLIDRDDRGPDCRGSTSRSSCRRCTASSTRSTRRGRAGSSAARLRPILRAARRRGAFVNFDMEQYAFKDVTLRIFREVLEEPEFRDWPDVGIAIQAYLHDTEKDLHDLLDWAKARGHAGLGAARQGGVLGLRDGDRRPERLAGPGLDREVAVGRLLRALLAAAAGELTSGCGRRSARTTSAASPAALALADELGVPPAAYEFQMLYGMGDEFKDVLVGLGRRVRIYTPYGQLLPGMAYLVRRLLENTSNESFLRATQAGEHPRGGAADEPGQRQGPGVSESDGNATATPRSAVPRRSTPASATSRRATSPARTSAGKMQAALDRVRGEFGRTYPLVINGESVSTAGDDRLASTRRTRRKSSARWRRRRSPTRSRRSRPRKDAFPAWRDTEPAVRAEYLRKIARGFRERRFELAAWIVHETGKPWRESDADVAEAIDFCEYYAAEMLQHGAARSAATWPARRTSTSTSRAAWPSSSPRGTSRSPS